MASLSQRTDKFRNDIRDKKIGCPAGHFLYDPRADADPNESILTVGIGGAFENQCGQMAEAFGQFWRSEQVRVLALFPDEEPVSFAQSSEYFRSIFFSLSRGSHQVFRSEVDRNLALDLSAEERAHWNEVNSIRFEPEQLEYLRTHHGTQLWKYISNNTPMMMDLVAPYPLADNSWISNVIIVFTVGHVYPEYPEHLRHSEVSAMVLTKYQDLANLARSAAGSQEVRDWAEKSRTRNLRGVHADHPPLSNQEAFALQENYMELRYRLTAERLVRPVVITRNEELMMLVQGVGVSKELMRSLFTRYSTAQLIPVFKHCRAKKIKGDEAIKRLVQEIDEQGTAP